MRYVAVFLLGPLIGSAQSGRPEEFSTIEGTVINAVTSEPVGKASLRLVPAGPTQGNSEWTESLSTLSDPGGKFAFRGIAPGKYRLRASRNGFLTLENGSRALVDLNRPQQIKDVGIRMTPQGVIAGRILDAEGDPLEGARIQLLRVQYVNGRKTLATTRMTVTNDLGEYRWSALKPERYYIYAESADGLPPTSDVKEDYAPAYYPGAAEAAGALPVDVAAGAQVRAADLMLRRERTASVKGRAVVELPGAPGIPTVTFTPYLGHNNSSAGVYRVHPAKVSKTGEFEIRTLVPGTYSVRAELGVYTSPVLKLEVAGAAIEGMVLRIGPGMTMAGRIRIEGDAKQDLKNLNLGLKWGGPEGDDFIPGSVRVAPDRTFREEDLNPGRYGIRVNGLPDGFYTKSIRVGETDVTYSGVDLTSGPPGPVDILISPKAARVSLAVQNRKTNQPAPGAIVVLAPQEKQRLAIAACYWHATADQFGRVVFRNVAPGEYKAYAWEDVESTAWMDADFMKPFEDKGASVTAAEAAQVDLQVDLIP